MLEFLARPIASGLGTMLAMALAATPPQQTVADAEIASRADAYMQGLHEAGQFNGSVLLARDGRVLFARGYGMANFEWDIPNSPSTRFRVGSITKQFTSMAIMELEERGLLEVDDLIGEHLPDYPKPVADQVTIHHLLTHSSGIPSYTGIPDFRRQMMMPVTVDDVIDRFKELPLEFEPGSSYRYNNSGYFLLGAIIENVSGVSYEAFLQDNIFTPLGMDDSGYDRSHVVLKHRASGYTRGRGGLLNAPYVDMGQPYAAGSLFSTVEDLLVWDQALYTDQLVSSASRERLFRPYIAVGDQVHYGYGWRISTVNGRRNVSHSGGINGFNSHISRFPDDRAVFIWLRNVVSPAARGMNGNLAAILFGEATAPAPPGPDATGSR